MAFLESVLTFMKWGLYKGFKIKGQAVEAETLGVGGGGG